MNNATTATTKKKAEALRTFDDSESVYNGSKPPVLNQNDSASPKKFTNEYSEKETMKQFTIVSTGQEPKNNIQSLRVPDTMPPMRSLTNANDKQKRRSKGGIMDNPDLMGHHSSSKVKRPPGPMGNQVKPINNMNLNNNTSERDSPLNNRKDTFSENDSPRGSFIEEKPAPIASTGLTTKEGSKLKTYGINIQDLTSKEALSNPPSKQALDNSISVHQEPPLSSQRLEANILLGADLSKQKLARLGPIKSAKSILKKTKQQIDESFRKSAIDLPLSSHSQRSKRSRGNNSANSIPKSVKFAPQEEIFLVESYKKFNKDEYHNEESRSCCSKGCTLI